MGRKSQHEGNISQYYLDVVNPPCRPLLGVNGFMIARSGFLLASMGPFRRIESAFETQGMDRLRDGLEPFWEFGRISYLSSIGGAVRQHPAVIAVDVFVANGLETRIVDGLGRLDEDVVIHAASIQIPRIETLDQD